MILRQVWLREGGINAKYPYTEMVAWLPADNRVKVGTVLTLKGDETKWTVLQLYRSMDLSDINQVWNVGGL